MVKYELDIIKNYLAKREMNLRSPIKDLGEILIGLEFEAECQPTIINDVFREKRKIYLEIKYYDGEIFVFEASKSGNKYVKRKL